MYRKLMYSVKTVNDICEERVLMNLLCYMFNTICGLFDTISAYRTDGTPVLLVIVHLSWVVNCAGRITLVCFAASSVVDQVSEPAIHVCRYVHVTCMQPRTRKCRASALLWCTVYNVIHQLALQ